MLAHCRICQQGLKARGMRIKGDDTPLMPGEFRDVDVPGGAIRDSITFIPYKEPSSVLYSLLGNIVEEGRRIGSVADIQVGDTERTGTRGHNSCPLGAVDESDVWCTGSPSCCL